MTPQEAVSMLDRQLVAHGEDVQLRRVTGTGGISFALDCRAIVRNFMPQELVNGSGIIQGDIKVILSPTLIIKSGWPGPEITPGTKTSQDIRVPRKDDKIVIGGRTRNVEAGAPIYLAGELVRIELQVRG